MIPGRTVFSQLTDLLPRRAFHNATDRYDARKRVRSFSCADQLLCMIFAQVTGRSSLRETVLCLNALGSSRYHCGIRGRVTRSTLAAVNERRDHRIFMDTAMAMIHADRLILPVDPDLEHLTHRVYAIDSTTIDLCLKLFPWALFRRRKAGIKAHTLFDVKSGIPVFLRVSNAKVHDVWFLDQIVYQPGAFYIVDKGYIDFERLHRVHAAGAFFVTRPKRGMKFRVKAHLDVAVGTGVVSDRLIRLRGVESRTTYPDLLRLIRYVDPDTGKRLFFITNNRTLDSATIALLYRKRWRIELFFKWVKQHLHIKAFFGTSPNAVKTQVWIAVIVFMLVVRLKHRFQLRQDINQVLQVLSVTILQKEPVFQVFSENSKKKTEDEDRNQLQLFNL
jgi:hypothetical protein